MQLVPLRGGGRAGSYDSDDEDGAIHEDKDDPTSPNIAVVRQISKEDPFFGPSASAPKNVEKLGGSHRAVDMDLDPSAIAASFGSPGGGGGDYEPMPDSADMLSSAISLAEVGLCRLNQVDP
jgi:hypothetical protein